MPYSFSSFLFLVAKDPFFEKKEINALTTTELLQCSICGQISSPLQLSLSDKGWFFKSCQYTIDIYDYFSPNQPKRHSPVNGVSMLLIGP